MKELMIPHWFFMRSSMMRRQSRHAVEVTLHDAKKVSRSREIKSRVGSNADLEDL